jgi:hypothetical protein
MPLLVLLRVVFLYLEGREREHTMILTPSDWTSPSPGRERGGLHYHSRMAGITSLPNSSMERMVASWDIRDS